MGTYTNTGGSFSQSTASNKAAQSRRGGGAVISARRDAPRNVKRAGDNRRAARSTNLTTLDSMKAIQGRRTGAIKSARVDGPQITDARPDLAPGGTMGTRDQRWTTEDGVNLLDQQHGSAGVAQPRPEQVDIHSLGKINSGGLGQGSNASGYEQQRIGMATGRLEMRERQLGEAGSEARLAEAQAGVDAFSYTPREAADIRARDAYEREVKAAGRNPAEMAAQRRIDRQAATKGRRDAIAARRGGSAVISARRDAPRPNRRQPGESKQAYQKRMAAQQPLTLEEQTERRLMERLLFDKQKDAASQEEKAVNQRIRIEQTVKMMSENGVQITPEIHGQVSKLETRLVQQKSAYEYAMNGAKEEGEDSESVADLRDDLADAMVPGGEYEPDDVDDIRIRLDAAVARTNGMLDRIGEVEAQKQKFIQEAMDEAREFLKTGNKGLEKASQESGAYGGGGGAKKPAKEPDLWSTTFNKPVTEARIKAYAKSRNIPIEEVKRLLGVEP